MNAAAPYGAPVAIPIACVTIAAAAALLAIGIAWARRATAPYGTHCKPRLAKVRRTWRDFLPRWWDWPVVQAYYLRRYKRENSKALAAEMRLVQDGTAPWLRDRTADPVPDGTAPGPVGAVPHHLVRDDGVIHIEPDGSITVRPRAYDWSPLRDTAADGIAVISGPWEYVRPYAPENAWTEAGQ